MVKISYAIMALTMFAIMSVPTQAQSLKGLGNKIKKAAQETVNDAAGAKKAGNSTSSPSIGGAEIDHRRRKIQWLHNYGHQGGNCNDNRHDRLRLQNSENTS